MQSRYRKAASLSLFFLNSKSYVTLLHLSCRSPAQVTLVSSCTSKGRHAALLLPRLSTSRRLVSSTLLLPLPKAGMLCSSALPEALSTQIPEDLVGRWREATRKRDWCNPSPSHQGTGVLLSCVKDPVTVSNKKHTEKCVLMYQIVRITFLPFFFFPPPRQQYF